MARIDSYPVLDFSGGVRRDVAPSQLKRNELLDARNVHLEERGRVITRLGSQQLGQTLTGTIENSFFFSRIDAGSGSLNQLLVNNNATTSVISILNGAVLSAGVAVGDTSISVNSTSNLTASGTVEIEGDLITYTGVGATTLTGVSGITSAHLSGAPVHQWSTLTQSGTAVNGSRGITYAVLNNILFFGGTNANLKQYNGTTVTDVSGEPGITLLTNYKDRLYGAGDGSTTTNGDPRRISFSARGDGTSWTPASDYFDVEDQAGQSVRALKVFSNNLNIFKDTKTFVYNEVELRQTLTDVGAYGNKVVEEINGNLYTFCDNGIFVTNGFSAKSIGEPVQEFFKNFTPTYDSSLSRNCTNTFAWEADKSYFLYIADITVPTTTNDVVLEYNTLTKLWTVQDGGYTDMVNINTFDQTRFGGGGGTNNERKTHRPVFIGGDSGGKVWRFNENRFINGSQVLFGSDIFVDLRSNTGVPIHSSIETPLYDLTYPALFKKFKNLRVYTESGQWTFEYRVEDERGISAYRRLGTVSTTNKVLPFPGDAQGWRCGFRITSTSSNAKRIFNGFIFEDTEVIPRP